MVDLVDAHGRPRVVVTGMGVKTPAGVTIDSFWERVCAGQGTAAPIERFDASELPVRFAGEVREFDSTPYFNPKEVRRVDRFTQLGFGAAADALEQAGELGADPSRVAVIAATGVGGLETMEENESTFLARGGDDSFLGSAFDDNFDGGAGTDTSLGMGDGVDTCRSVEVLAADGCESVEP